MSFSVFSQNPTVINDSLVVNQRLYAKEKLIVDKEAKFKQDVVINGDLRIKSDLRIDSTLRVDGVARFNDYVKLTNVSLTTINDTAIKILVLMPNGTIKKVDPQVVTTISENLPIYCPPGDVPNPYWSSGLNKIYVACPPVNVGISTAFPVFKLHVEGNTYSHKFICGNTSGTLTALVNGFAKNDFDNLINLGVKIGASTEVVRFAVTNKGATTIANGGSQTSLTIRNGIGHAAEFYANNGTKIFKFGNDGSVDIVTSTGIKTFELGSDGSLTWRNNGGVGFIAKNTDGNHILKLGDDGILYSKEIIITIPPFPDYVFQEDYNLMPLSEVKKYVSENKHLPGIQSADHFAESGVSVGEMQVDQMEKIENIYLYLFEMDEKIKNLQLENQSLKTELESIKNSNK